MSKTRETIADVRAERTRLYEQIQELVSENVELRTKNSALDDRTTRDSSIIDNLSDKLVKAEKDRDAAVRDKDFWIRSSTAGKQENDMMHDFFDLLTNPPPRTLKKGEHDYTLSITERFTLWILASK